jgi:hypothetical protein
MAVAQSSAPARGLEELAWLVQSEFAEMPGMHLTFAQVQRLSKLSTSECRAVLKYLITTSRLAQGADDQFYLAEFPN